MTDYNALAKQFGAVSSVPQGQSQGVSSVSSPISASSAPIDYSALAKQFGGVSSTPVPTDVQPQSFLSKIGGGIINGAKAVGNFLTSSEQNLGQDIAAGASSILPNSVTGQSDLNYAIKNHVDALTNTAKLINQYKTQGKDTSKLESVFQNEIKNSPPSMTDLYPALNKTNWQVVGDTAGTLADILSAGSYGTLAKGAETGVLLTSTARKAATPIVQQGVKATLGQTLKTIGKETIAHSATGAGVGYGYDVTGNLQQGKAGAEALMPGAGTLTGAIAPALIGGVRAGVAVTKDQAPRFINSLIKPTQAGFSYGKDPGRTVAELGITGNSLPDFEKNISTTKSNIGQQIGSVYASPLNQNVRINTTDEIKKIDTAIMESAKGGKNNQNIVTQLKNVKDAILYEHAIDSEGSIVKTGTQPRNLNHLTAQEAQNLIQHVADQTQFTGRPSDDKTVNSVLKSIYGGIREKINTAVSPNTPEIIKLNQQYADLTSAEIATRNRDKIVQRSNIISMPIKVGATTAGIVEAIANPHAAIPIIIGGATAAALDKAMGSTAVKTRVAAWLGKQTPNTIQKFLLDNPNVAPILRRVFPALVSKITH